MGTIFQQVLDLITTNPGNLIYHVVLAFTILGALQAALNLWRHDQFPQGRRMVIGLGLLLGIRLILFLGAGLGLIGLVDPHIILPNLDRAVMAFSLIIILWLWIFPEITTYGRRRQRLTRFARSNYFYAYPGLVGIQQHGSSPLIIIHFQRRVC